MEQVKPKRVRQFAPRIHKELEVLFGVGAALICLKKSTYRALLLTIGRKGLVCCFMDGWVDQYSWACCCLEGK